MSLVCLVSIRRQKLPSDIIKKSKISKQVEKACSQLITFFDPFFSRTCREIACFLLIGRSRSRYDVGGDRRSIAEQRRGGYRADGAHGQWRRQGWATVPPPVDGAASTRPFISGAGLSVVLARNCADVTHLWLVGWLSSPPLNCTRSHTFLFVANTLRYILIVSPLTDGSYVSTRRLSQDNHQRREARQEAGPHPPFVQGRCQIPPADAATR